MREIEVEFVNERGDTFYSSILVDLNTQRPAIGVDLTDYDQTKDVQDVIVKQIN